MSALPLAGPSSSLRSLKADAERTVNWVPVLIESGNGKGGNRAYLKQCAGLRSLGVSLGSLLGLAVARGVLYAATSGQLVEIAQDLTTTNRGAVANGIASFAVNQTQLCIVQGQYASVYDLDAHTTTVLSDNWRGSVSADVLDGFGIFAEPGTNQFYYCDNQDFTVFDPLNFASAEGSTGNIIGYIVKHRELILLKEATGEVWYDSGDADFALSRNQGANLEVGCMAGATLKKVGGVAYWLGRDDKGQAVVFGMSAYAPQRISDHSLEEKLAVLSDFSGATAFTYHLEGLTYYVLNVPGLETTWEYEVSSGIWHERAEWVDGAYQPWRVKFHALCYGMHIVGDDAGNLYELTHTVNTHAGDVMVRDRLTPHAAGPDLGRSRVGSLQVDCDVGQGKPDGSDALMLMRYSDDGGSSWSSWRQLTLGAIGDRYVRARATMLGSARDRVWQFRVTDDVMCNVLSAVVNEK